MKHLHKFLIVSIILLMFVSVSVAQEYPREVNWEAFSKNLVMALGSSNEGLQMSAMGMIIRYGDNLSVKDGVFDVMKIFRNHKDHRVRILAMVTLNKMGCDWAMYVLKRNIKFETDERVKKHCCNIVQSYYAQKNVQAKEDAGLYSAVEE